MKKYRITFTGYNNYYGEQKKEKIVESETFLYPTELLSHIISYMGECECICDKFTIICEEMKDTTDTTDTQDTYSADDRAKWGILA